MENPMQGFILPWHLLFSIFLPCLLLPKEFPQQLIFECHLTDVLPGALGFVWDSGFDTYHTHPALFLAGVHSLDFGLGVEIIIHCEEPLDLHISSFHILLWSVHYINRYLMTDREYETCSSHWAGSLGPIFFWWYLNVAVFHASSFLPSPMWLWNTNILVSGL